MSVEAWPFLVSRNRTIGYTTIVAPQFLSEAHAAGMLALAAGGEDQHPNRVLYREVDGSQVGDMTIVFRIVQAEQQDIGLSGSDPLRDQFGRPIRLIEGLVFRGHVPNLTITHEDMQDAHESVKDAYKVFWETADSSFSAHPSQRLVLRKNSRILDDQRVRFIKEPSFRPSPKRDSKDVNPTISSSLPRDAKKSLKPTILVLSCIAVAALIGSYFFPEITTTIFPPLSNLFPPSHVIKIAVDLPLSGENKSSGVPIAYGIKYAIDQANRSKFLPGYTFEEYQAPGQSPDQPGLDDQSDPNIGKTNVTEAISDSLTAAIIGPYNSGVAQQEIPITNSTPIAQISPATTNPCLTKNTVESGCTGSYNLLPTLRPNGQVTYFRLPATDDLQAKVLTNYLRAKSYRTAYVIRDSQDLYSSFFAQMFITDWQQAGGTFIGQDNAPGNPSIQDYATQLRLIPPGTSPDVVFFTGTMPAAANAKAAMSQVPQFSKAAFVGGAGIKLDSFAQSVQGDTPVFSGVSFEDTSTIDQFKISYLSSGYSADEYGPYTASANDSTIIVMQAIKNVLAQGISTPRGSWDKQGAMTFRKAIIHQIATISRESIMDQLSLINGGSSTQGLSLATNFQSFDTNGDNTSNYISIYSLVGTAWQLQESYKV